MTTVTISPALKQELERIRDTEDFSSLNATIKHILRNPNQGERRIHGEDEKLTAAVSVEELTQHVLKRLRDREDYADYEAVIRARAGIAQRDTGEQPIELEPLA